MLIGGLSVHAIGNESFQQWSRHRSQQNPWRIGIDDVARRRSRFVAYGRATFALKDLERVSNCAYFDYQRERVYVRTDKKVAKLVKQAKKKLLARKPNQVIEPTDVPSSPGRSI